ncbi:MAG TPA: response regulator, partial [Minicystis sp.]|nr:response regulator [Minicystis sp.]
MRAIGRATGTLIEPLEPAPVGALTLEQLADRVAHELRRGLVEEAGPGRAANISFGGGADVLASVYAVLGELRTAVGRASGGGVQFEARPQSGAPALVGSERADLSQPGARRLHGRRVIVAGEDTALVLLLANLLREQGATVHEFTDGREAREAASRERPDLVITGARVPNLDGFALCRELRRDPLLADVPVLLVPPREQLLSRGKEPSASTQLQREQAEQLLASAERL